MIKFFCSTCGKKIGVPDTMAGKRGKCPGCGAALTVPPSSSQAPAARAPSQEDTDYNVAMEGGGASAPTRVITFTCPECWREITVATTGEREKTKCTGCGALVTVPSESTVPGASQGRPSPVPPMAGRQSAGSRPGVMDVAASGVRVVGCFVVLASLGLGLLWPPIWGGVLVGLILMCVKARA